MSQEDKHQHIIQRLTCLKDSSLIQTGMTLDLYQREGTDRSVFFVNIPALADQLFEVFDNHHGFSFEECRAYIRIVLGIKEQPFD
jgi:hypothetical protein